MKAEFLNPFVRSVTRIIEDSITEAPTMEKVYLRESYPYKTDTVAIIVGITGHLTGQVVISLSDECARGIAAAMMMEDTVHELDEYAQSALAEMSNMITANATIGLAEAGFPCDITPPSIITSTRMEITNPSGIRTVVIPLQTSKGKIDINLSLIETSEFTDMQREKTFKTKTISEAGQSLT